MYSASAVTSPLRSSRCGISSPGWLAHRDGDASDRQTAWSCPGSLAAGPAGARPCSSSSPTPSCAGTAPPGGATGRARAGGLSDDRASRSRARAGPAGPREPALGQRPYPGRTPQARLPRQRPVRPPLPAEGEAPATFPVLADLPAQPRNRTSGPPTSSRSRRSASTRCTCSSSSPTTDGASFISTSRPIRLLIGSGASLSPRHRGVFSLAT